MIKDLPGQTLDDNQEIWRYMDFASFYSMLLTQGLFFKRLDKYTDANEGTLWEETNAEQERALLRKDPLMSKQEAKQRVERENANIESYKIGTLSHSWIMSNVENYAMWKIYLRGSSEGVAIKTTIGQLRQALDGNNVPILLGKVKYEPLSILDINQHNVSTNKRAAYSYENEMRALVFNQFDNAVNSQSKRIKTPHFEVGKSFKITVDKLIGEIWISPFSDKWFEDVVKSTVQTYLPTFAVNSFKSSRIKDK